MSTYPRVRKNSAAQAMLRNDYKRPIRKSWILFYLAVYIAESVANYYAVYIICHKRYRTAECLYVCLSVCLSVSVVNP